MAFDTVIDKAQFETALTASANAIREKTGRADSIEWLADKGFADAIGAIAVGGGGSDGEWFNDGDTHIWITLQEGRTSPKLGVCPKGTVTVDWGDGTEPDVLTGTSTSTVKWTPTHNYFNPGDYIITLRVDGSVYLSGSTTNNQYAYLLRHVSGSNAINKVYLNSITKVEIGNGITSIHNSAFNYCTSLTSVKIPDSVTSIGQNAFQYCYSLASIDIPDSVTSIGQNAFSDCHSLTSVIIPDRVMDLYNYALSNCYALTSVTIGGSVASIGTDAFRSCTSLASIIILGSLRTIYKSAFYNCSGVRYFDFTRHTTVPTLNDTNAFSGVAEDYEIRVPAALYDEWIAATNWSTYASQIVAVQ